MTRALACTSSATGTTAFVPAPFARARRGVLQRKYAWGQHTGSGGCLSCAKKRTSFGNGPQLGEHMKSAGHSSQALPGSLRQQGLAGMRVSAASTKGASSRGLETASTQQSATDELDERKYGADGILMTREGSGTCMNGGAEAKCNRGSGAYNKPGADNNALVQKYNDWMTRAGPVTECHAYKGEVDCAKSLAKAKDCDRAGRNTNCCKDIRGYQTKYAEFARVICAAAANDAQPVQHFAA